MAFTGLINRLKEDVWSKAPYDLLKLIAKAVWGVAVLGGPTMAYFRAISWLELVVIFAALIVLSVICLLFFLFLSGKKPTTNNEAFPNHGAASLALKIEPVCDLVSFNEEAKQWGMVSNFWIKLTNISTRSVEDIRVMVSVEHPSGVEGLCGIHFPIEILPVEKWGGNLHPTEHQSFVFLRGLEQVVLKFPEDKIAIFAETIGHEVAAGMAYPFLAGYQYKATVAVTAKDFSQTHSFTLDFPFGKTPTAPAEKSKNVPQQVEPLLKEKELKVLRLLRDYYGKGLEAEEISIHLKYEAFEAESALQRLVELGFVDEPEDTLWGEGEYNPNAYHINLNKGIPYLMNLDSKQDS